MTEQTKRFRRLSAPDWPKPGAVACAAILTPRTPSRTPVCAFRAFDGFRGDSGRPCSLSFLRNSCKLIGFAATAEATSTRLGEEELHGGVDAARFAAELASPRRSSSAELRERIDAALAKARTFREAIVLRDLEDLSYREIAQVAQVPIGTVMSRLARGRRLMLTYLTQAESGVKDGV